MKIASNLVDDVSVTSCVQFACASLEFSILSCFVVLLLRGYRVLFARGVENTAFAWLYRYCSYILGTVSPSRDDACRKSGAKASGDGEGDIGQALQQR